MVLIEMDIHAGVSVPCDKFVGVASTCALPPLVRSEARNDVQIRGLCSGATDHHRAVRRGSPIAIQAARDCIARIAPVEAIR